MKPARAAAWMFAAAVLGAWLASAAGVSRSPQTPVALSAPPEPHPVEAVASDVQAQASRLRQRLAAAPAPQPPVRNPFTFSPRQELSSPRARAKAEHPPPAPAPLPPAEPVLTLIGIAEKKVGDAVVRTAMMSNEMDDLIMAVVGQRVLGAYEVVAIGLDAVELKDTATGATRRLALR